MKPSEEQNQINLLLDEFEKSIGKQFSISFKNDNITAPFSQSDIVVAVDRELQMIVGEKGEYPVVWCNLKQPHPAQLKKHKKYSLQSMF